MYIAVTSAMDQVRGQACVNMCACVCQIALVGCPYYEHLHHLGFVHARHVDLGARLLSSEGCLGEIKNLPSCKFVADRVKRIKGAQSAPADSSIYIYICIYVHFSLTSFLHRLCS